MPSKDPAIKIIKRPKGGLPSRETEVAVTPPKSEKQSRREILKTVASWIEERREAKKDPVGSRPRFV